MATKHGNRVYIQVLLEPFRGELFMQEASAQGVKPAALIRQLVYNYLAEKPTNRFTAKLWSTTSEKLAGRCRRQTEGSGLKETDAPSLISLNKTSTRPAANVTYCLFQQFGLMPVGPHQ